MDIHREKSGLILVAFRFGTSGDFHSMRKQESFVSFEWLSIARSGIESKINKAKQDN